MSLISASIPNLINGVSQQPPSLRLKTQAELQENGLSSVVNGLSKRPATKFLANLGNITGAENAFIHTMRRDEFEYYTLVVTTNDVYVFDKDGNERNVTGDLSYITGLSNPAESVAATTVADYTFIANKTVSTAESSATSPVRSNEALVYVKQGDYRTKYSIKITKGGTVYTRELETMSSTQDTTALTSDAERSIQTDRLAHNLRYDVTSDATYYGSTSGGSIPGIAFVEYGNVLHIRATDGSDFKVEVEDSRGNQHIFAFKGTVGDFKKLPPTGPEGFVIAVAGDNDKGQDDYYVRLMVDETGGQVWKETIAPNAKIALNASTMPHQLVSNADGSFTFQQATYKERAVGDDNTNPFPSFVGLPIYDIFFHRNRLGFLADENVILSEAGQFEEFNFFKRTTLTLLDTDLIDAAVSNNKVSILKHAVPFNESLLLFSDLTQFRLTAQDLLTPETVAIDVTTQFEATLNAKPVGAGRYVFFSTRKGKWSGIREYFVDVDAQVDDAADITAHVPNYLPGTVRKMEASSNEDILLVLTEDDPNAIYVYSYYWQGTDKLQSSWSRWTFGGKVLNISFNKSDIDVLIRYETATGHDVVLERMNLTTDESAQYTKGGHDILLDRRIMFTGGDTVTSSQYVGEPAPVIVTDGGKVLDTLQQAQDYIDGASGRYVWTGIPYTFLYQFSEQVMKNNNEPMTTGRLQIRKMAVVYNDTGFFETIVTPKARGDKTTKFTGRLVGSAANILNTVAIETGTYDFAVLSKSSEVDIKLRSSSHLPCTFQSAEWEGFFVMRSQRI